MHRRKLKITIIPHEGDNVKTTKFFIIGIPILLLIIIIISIYMITITVINIKNLKDYSEIKSLRKDVAILTIKTRESKKNIRDIEKGIEKLQIKTKSLEPSLKYLSGITATNKDTIDIPTIPDSLLIFTKYLVKISDTIFSIIKNPSYANKIPSIIPVSGWVFRPFGYVIDPYTQTRRFNPGIVFISEENTPIYASAEGYVLFAGIKDKLGKTIIIKHDKNFVTTYGHLSSIEVKNGNTVKKGDLIGYIGKSGKTLSPALYYEIKHNDKTINPEYSFLIPVYMLYDSLRILL